MNSIVNDGGGSCCAMVAGETPTLPEACGCYFTAIFMFSLPILATTIEPEKDKKNAEVTIFTAKCNAAIDVAKELETLSIKAERKHREAEKQYEAFCKRNRG